MPEVAKQQPAPPEPSDRELLEAKIEQIKRHKQNENARWDAVIADLEKQLQNLP